MAKTPEFVLPVQGVKIHSVAKDWDDGDPLYEVDATITFEDGTKKFYYFDWVRAAEMQALRNPSTPHRRFLVWCLITGEDPWED